MDGDDTPWSKAFLCSAYASRGLKMRVTSGGGAEVLMGAAEGKSMFYLESRCVALARAIGAQGVQNGGIDGASVVGSVPDGMRELLAENLLVMLRDLESCSGNDALVSESDMRRTAHTVPLFLAGSDFLFSGFGSIPRYDNMFGPSNFNGEDLDDYLVLQRDWGVDGALRPVDEERLRERARARRPGAALGRLPRRSGSPSISADDRVVAEVVARRGLQRPDAARPAGGAGGVGRDHGTAARHPRRRPRSLGDRLREEAERVLAMGRAHVAGDYLQTAAIFDEDMNVPVEGHRPQRLPGAGHRLRGPGGAAASEMAAIRQQRSRARPAGAARRRSRHRPATCASSAPATPGPGTTRARSAWASLAGACHEALVDDVRPAGGRGAAADHRRHRGGGMRRAHRARAARRSTSG